MEVRIKEPMKRHTSFRAGGLADWFVIPETVDELKAVLSVCRKAGADWYVIGNGSNLLVSDKGFRGVIISTGKLDRLEVTGSGASGSGLTGSEASGSGLTSSEASGCGLTGSEDTGSEAAGCGLTACKLTAGAGVLLSRAANAALKAGLTGMEFAAGIPGSVGGAAVMNAGAYGSEMKDILKTVTVLDGNGNVKVLEAEELELGYRTSSILKNHYLVLEAEFSLMPGEAAAIRGRMEELAARRREKQPLEYPSAGSTFKRPSGCFAGKLIEDTGLKGFSIGGAAVSEKHAGFVINKGEASASDIYRVCTEVKKQVFERTGVMLELEVKLLGPFEEDERP